jgi:enoyl-CoA hydratase
MAFDEDKTADVAVFWGEGGAFCAGADLKSLAAHGIAAIEGPAVAGGMELALWADCRVMGKGDYMGVYNRRWGVPLTDGGTVRLPRLVGEGRALELIITGRKVEADECLRIGLCEKVVPTGQARHAAEEIAHVIGRFPQLSLRADLRSVYLQHGLAERLALETEWYNCTGVFKAESAAGVARFVNGAGRHGDFGEEALAN